MDLGPLDKPGWLLVAQGFKFIVINKKLIPAVLFPRSRRTGCMGYGKNQSGQIRHYSF